jgi:Pyoverdine/dityrosine biosynthesis protein
LEQISSAIKHAGQIRLVIPSLPFKLSSPLKVRGQMPDLAEVNYLLQLFEISYGIDLLFREFGYDKPSSYAKFIVISDGRRFNELVGEADAAIKQYVDQIEWWITCLGISDFVEIVDYRELLERSLPSELLAEKVRIRREAEECYSELMWPVFDPTRALESLSMTMAIEPDPERLNPTGRFGSLLRSLVYTINYDCLDSIKKAVPSFEKSRYLALYRELTAQLFTSYPEASPCQTEEVLRQARSGKPFSPNALECLRQAMLREVWAATIRYMAEIKSDRDLLREPISVSLPGAIRWTIHAKRGQIAIKTPTTQGLSVQAWAGTAVFKRSKNGGIKLCTLPVVALEGAGSIPVTIVDDGGLFGLGDQPLCYIHPNIAFRSVEGFMSEVKESLTRTRVS